MPPDQEKRRPWQSGANQKADSSKQNDNLHDPEFQAFCVLIAPLVMLLVLIMGSCAHD